MEQELNSHLILLETLYTKVTSFVVDYSFQLVGAMIIFIIGYLVAGWTARTVERFCLKHKLDPILVRFIANGSRALILIGVGIICLGKFGISVAPFVAVLGAVSLGAGLALQGVVSNYGAGLSLMLTRPFAVGDTLTVHDVSGVVTQVNLTTTLLDTEDGEIITIPNKQIIGEILRNSHANKIWEGTIGIAYNSDYEKAIALIVKVLADDKAVVSEPTPQVGIQNFGRSAIEIAFRYWVPTREYHRTGYRVNQTILQQFRDHAIEIPFPQYDVRLLK